MELVTIGKAAQMLALNTSALRYYEDRGLVTPERRGGKRMYSREQLRRLAFIQLMQRLGIRLDAASAVLHEPSEQWRAWSASRSPPSRSSSPGRTGHATSSNMRWRAPPIILSTNVPT